MGNERARVAGSVRLSTGAAALLALTPAMADCKMAGDPMGPAVLAGYVSRPSAILSEHPLGGVGLDILAARLGTATPDSLSAMMSVVADGSNKQRAAIGSGLAAGANTCQKQDSAVVQRIINAVKRSGSAVLQRAFAIDYDVGPASNATSDTPDRSAGAARILPQSLTLPKLTTTDKLPDPFGPPDGWR